MGLQYLIFLSVVDNSICLVMGVTGNLIPVLIQFSLLLSRKGHFYLQPTKLRNGNVFSHVYQFVCSEGIPIQDSNYSPPTPPFMDHLGHVQTC